MALVSGMRGDDEGYARWLAIGKALRTVIDQLPGATDVVGTYVEARWCSSTGVAMPARP
jgi:hypothetical protein